MPQYNYIAIARNGAGLIAKGDRITFTSERQVEESTGLSFRHEIAEAVRQQLHADVDPSQEAQTATNFDVYSESRYAEVREKLEAAAAREQAAEEKRKRAEEREQAKAEREAQRAEKQATGKKNSNDGRIGQNNGSSKTKKKTTRKKGISLGPLGKIKLKSLLKFLVAAVAVIWFISTNLKSCSLQSILDEIGVKTEQTTTKKKSTTKKATTTTKKKSTTSSATRKTSTTSAKKSTSSTSKKSSTSSSTRKSSATKSSANKKSTSSKKSTTKRKTSRN